MRSREQPLIAILMEEGPDLMVGIFATLKAGCGFVPIRPSQPDARISYILADCGIRILLTDQTHLERARRFVDGAGPLEHVIAIDGPLDALLDAQAEHAAPVRAGGRPQYLVPRDPDLTCYVAYTSGSTGNPKGVVVSHRNVMALMLWSRDYLALGPHTRTAQNLSFAFDFGIYELFTTILFGGSLHFYEGDRALDIDGFVRFLDTSRCNTLHTSVSYFRLMLSSGRGLDMLRAVHLGAESLPKELVIEARGALSPDCAVFHGYGPTEATINCTMVEVRPAWLAQWERCRFIPIGWVSARNRIYILDRDLNPLPVGVAGELYVGGDGVALGYRDPAATAERFIPDPFAIEPGQRMYTTGDVARWLPDGNIEYLGRRDDQIKIRGFRVELGEIEAALRRHPGIHQAAVVVYEDAPGNKRLVAYCAASGAPSAAELRSFTKEQVPSYMVPASFVVLDQLPLNANGKIDRARLPALARPDTALADQNAGEDAGEPMSATESRIAVLWANGLGIARVGRHDNFFALGGDSIQCIQIASSAREQGLDFQPSDLFRHPTVAELAEALAARPARDEAPGPLPEQGRLSGVVPLGPIQRWFLDEGFEDVNHWNQAICLEAPPSLTPERVEQVLAMLLEHHDMLRARFWRDGAGWQQEILAQAHVPHVGSHDLSQLARAAQDDEQARRCTALQASLDIQSGSLVQCALFDLGSQRGKRLLLIIHHLVIDGISWRILVEDFARIHQQLEAGQPASLPAKTLSFRQWIEGLRGRAALAHGQGARDLEAATCLSRDFASEANLEGAVSEIVQTLSHEDNHALLHVLPRSHGLAIQELLLAALADALCAWTGAPRISLMLEQHGREAMFAGADVARTVGWFTSLLPVTLAAEPDHPEMALHQARAALAHAQRRAIEHQMARYLHPAAQAPADPDRSIEVAFNYLGRLDVAIRTGAFALASEPTGAMRGARNHRAFVLEIDAAVVREQLEVRWRYSESLHRRATIEAVSRNFAAALQRMLAHGRSVSADSSVLARGTDARLPAEVRAGLEQRYGEIEDVYPLTAMQEGMLFHSALAPEAGVYVEQLHAELDGPLDVARFTEAWGHLVAHHPVLRTVCIADGLAQPLQAVLARIALPIERLDWRDRGAPEQAHAFAMHLQRDLERGLPPTQAPLFRLYLIQRAPSAWYFVFSHHHLLLDGWSLGLLFQDLFRLYEELGQDRPPAIAARAGFGDYVSWLNSQDLEREREFWQAELHGIQAAAPMSLEQPSAGTHAAEPSLRAALSTATTAALRSLARTRRHTLSTVLHAAAAILIARYTGRSDVVLGTVSSGRSAPIPDCESMIGLLINTVPLRLHVDLRAPLAAWLHQLDARIAGVRAHEHTPLRHIRSWCGLSAEATLFDVLLVIENYPIENALRTGMGGLRFANVHLRERTNHPITLSVTPGEQLDISLQYDPSRITRRAAERMLEHFRRVLEQLAHGDHATLSGVSLLPRAERDMLVIEHNATTMPEPVPGLVHRSFEQQVERTPDAIAVVAGDDALTYAALNQRANQLAHHLRRLGIGPDVRVGLLFARSLELVVAMLGVLKAGGAYVPLDSGQPRLRLERMARAAGVRLILCTSDCAPGAAGFSVETMSLDRARAVLANEPVTNPESDVAGDHLAYVLYTSGSTGEPKGAMISHRAIANHMAWMLRAFPLEPADRWLQKTPIGFDASVLELFAPLLAGAQLVMAGPEAHRDVQELCQALLHHRITHLQVVPSLLQALLEAPRFGQCRSLRRLFSGGEALTTRMRDRFSSLHAGAALINLYGPTEATVDACSHVCRAGDAVTSTVPIGRPVDNLRAYVLDEELEPVPVGIVGELYLGGLGLARGYLDRPDLTAESFIPDHVSGIPGARLYRTGDLAMWSYDGGLVYHGRLDGQVKLGGNRIELAEIEAALESHPAVRRAAAVSHARSAERKSLLAFVVAGAAIAAGDLRAHLSERLPLAMIPSRIVFREDLPLTASGKLDRRELARLAADAAQEPRLHAAPTSEEESALTEIWRQILQVEQVGVHDSFFDLGGDSLAAIRVVSRIRDHFEVELTLQDFFATRTVAELAARIPALRARTVTAAPIRAQQPAGAVPAGAVIDVDQLSDAEVELLLRALDKRSPGE